MLRNDRETQPKVTLSSTVEALFEAEEAIWKLAPGPEGFLSNLDDEDVLGYQLINHGNSIKFIHGYFSNFESRKCCLNLVAGKRNLTAVRVVSSNLKDIPLEEGVALHKQGSSIRPTEVLSEQEFRVFRRCLLTARFPRLSVPGAPLDDLPSPPPSHAAPSPVSLADSICSSEVDDLEDISLIPSETLITLVHQLFGLRSARAKQFERLIFDQYKRKSDAKILAEEFAAQLTLLENNKNLFYNPSSFISRFAYDAWKHSQRTLILNLIEKFWSTALPPVKTAQFTPGSEHSDFRFLVHRVICYEGGLHPDPRTATHGYSVSLPISSASARLLREFSLRYGIGDLFCKLVHLEYLSENFENEIWFINHTTHLIEAITDALPSNLSRALIVNEEFQIMAQCIERLLGQCKNSLTRIHRLFLDTSVTQGISSLIDLLSKTLLLKSRLESSPPVLLGDLLYAYAQENFRTAYERHKLIAFTDLKLDPLSVSLSPKLLNRVLSSIRDQVSEYKCHYNVCFARFFDLGQAAATAFYNFLQDDVEELCSIKSHQRVPNKLDLSMLSLAYRLNQLDQDWMDIIPVSMQRWRNYFREEIHHWIKVLERHTLKLVLQAVAVDQFQVASVSDWASTSNGVASIRSNSAVSSVSLTPSARSAFSAVKPQQPLNLPSHDAPPGASVQTDEPWDNNQTAEPHPSQNIPSADSSDAESSLDEDDLVARGNDPYPNITVETSSIGWQSMSWQSASMDFGGLEASMDLPAPVGETPSGTRPVDPDPLPPAEVENPSVAEESHKEDPTPPSAHSNPGAECLETEPRAKTLLVPGSLIDVLVILNRTVATTETLCEMLLPWKFDQNEATVPGDFDPVAYRSEIGLMIRDRLQGILSRMIHAYADNLLCMDLCGTQTGVAERLIGSKLVEHLKTASKSHDYIWGCRHMTLGQKDCFAYVNKQAAYLADKFEPIVQEMCTRINSVGQFLSVAAQFFAKASRLSPYLSDGNQRSDVDIVGQVKGHLREVHEGMISLLSHRVYLFFNEAYHLLLHLSIATLDAESRFSPLIQFLDNHLTALQSWLYAPAFLSFVESLWDSIVKTIEYEVINLRDLLKDQDLKAGIILRSIIILLRLFRQFVGQGSFLDKLTVKVDRVSFWLHLYSQSTERLIEIHDFLADQMLRSSSSLSDHMKLTSVQVDSLRRGLHADKKSFSGRHLRNWLLRNLGQIAELDPSSDPELFSDADIFAQHLLDTGLVIPMETLASQLATPTPDNSAAPYPDIVCYSQRSMSVPAGTYDDHSSASSTLDTPFIPGSLRETQNTPSPLPQDEDPPTDLINSYDLSLTYSHGDPYHFHNSPEHFYHFRALGLEDLAVPSNEEPPPVYMPRPRSNDIDTAKMDLYQQKGLDVELLLGIIIPRARDDAEAKDFLLSLPFGELQRYPWLMVHKQPLLLSCLRW